MRLEHLLSREAVSLYDGALFLSLFDIIFFALPLEKRESEEQARERDDSEVFESDTRYWVIRR